MPFLHFLPEEVLLILLLAYLFLPMLIILSFGLTYLLNQFYHIGL
jgi:hypothetical protein